MRFRAHVVSFRVEGCLEPNGSSCKVSGFELKVWRRLQKLNQVRRPDVSRLDNP